MSTYKKTGSRSASSSRSPSNRRPVENNTKKNTLRTPEKKTNDPDSVINQILPYVFALLAFSIAFCLIFTGHSGFVGKSIVKPLLCGLLGWGAVAVPITILIQAILWKKSVETDSAFLKLISSVFILISVSIIIHIFVTPADKLSLNPVKLWDDGKMWTGGGLIGGFISTLFLKGIGKTLTLCVFIPVAIVFTTFLLNYTPHTAYSAFKDKLKNGKEKLENYDEKQKVWHSIKEKEKLKISEDVLENNDTSSYVDMSAFDQAVKEKNKDFFQRNDSFDPDVPLDELAKEVNDTEKDTKKEIVSPLDVKDHSLDNSNIPDAKELELMVERNRINDQDLSEKKEVLTVKEYEFPPLSLLNLEKNVKNEDVSEEMRSTAIKLVETLRSFKVKTKIIDVSRGPSVTRYELAPEEGVRVRAIANLVDDISLNLASSGVRIEAPIPGKAAVGIEVPNKNVSIVYLRELLDDQQFRSAKSRITVALGMDVAGTPIYVDIAKMPHLLIAGATGMGKSVCINSMIVSLLYKATPDEVKLILIDPKKVELSIYNGLPHLLVPVVTDPKKATGSLRWAVTEMDRRFELIEEVGVRDVASYNKITKDDPEKEFLPQVVIVIDELADLMMTAPKEVEDSICRLAQKARAAGMHLVIGTQRPSVDVVTGLIKANIPSRIAFTMASQVDSRTIIDIAGAEKLIGRGDMLYAPVGFSKPVRVQGSFVSESEIEKIVDFIKSTSGVSSYDQSVTEIIEKEAAKCGEGKNAHDPDDETDTGEDPLFRAAVEVAVTSGKISTSLLQRRLSIGYGRAAKLIDRMEQKGIVSANDGSNKARNVLISNQEYLEMAFRNEE